MEWSKKDPQAFANQLALEFKPAQLPDSTSSTHSFQGPENLLLLAGLDVPWSWSNEAHTCHDCDGTAQGKKVCLCLTTNAKGRQKQFKSKGIRLRNISFSLQRCVHLLITLIKLNFASTNITAKVVRAEKMQVIMINWNFSIGFITPSLTTIGLEDEFTFYCIGSYCGFYWFCMIAFNSSNYLGWKPYCLNISTAICRSVTLAWSSLMIASDDFIAYYCWWGYWISTLIS